MKDLLKLYNPEKTGFFRFKLLNGKYLITNDIGDFVLLSKKDFESFISGTISEKSKSYSKLLAGGFIKHAASQEAGSSNSSNLPSNISTRWISKNSYLFIGPSLHIIVLTRRCNLSCVYCHAGADLSSDTDMTEDTARHVLDIIFKSPSPAISIEFQGGEPLLNWPVLSFIVVEARKRAAKIGKDLVISLVTNFMAMTEEKLRFLSQHSVRICSSLDGPKSLHNKNRVYAKGKGDSHAAVVKWIKKIKESSDNAFSSVDALLTITRSSLSKPKQIVDEYVRLGMNGIYIRFLNPFGAAKLAWDDIGYLPSEYLDFYKKALDYIIELNNSGQSTIIEHTARILLKKIFGRSDPNFLDLRSPCGAGIGQIAYNYDGSVYTCDEGRMLAAMGDVSFCMGDVNKNNYRQLITSPAVKCLVTASINDLQPLCSSCAYKPYCGICPIFNYSEHGDLFMHGANYRCKIYEGILDHLFSLMSDKKILKLFQAWVEKQPEEN